MSTSQGPIEQGECPLPSTPTDPGTPSPCAPGVMRITKGELTFSDCVLTYDGPDGDWWMSACKLCKVELLAGCWLFSPVGKPPFAVSYDVFPMDAGVAAAIIACACSSSDGEALEVRSVAPHIEVVPVAGTYTSPVSLLSYAVVLPSGASADVDGVNQVGPKSLNFPPQSYGAQKVVYDPVVVDNVVGEAVEVVEVRTW